MSRIAAAPVSAAPVSWTGYYLGVDGGGGWGGSNTPPAGGIAEVEIFATPLVVTRLDDLSLGPPSARRTDDSSHQLEKRKIAD